MHDKKSEEETKKILLEIDRINQNLGYVKRTSPTKVSTVPKPPVESYFFPRERQLAHRSIAPQNFIFMVPFPFNTQSFFYPTPYLELPMREARKFQPLKGKKYKKPFSGAKTFKDDPSSLNAIETPVSETVKNETAISQTNPGQTQSPDENDLLDTIIDQVVDDDEEEDNDEDDDDDEEDDDDDEYIDTTKEGNRKKATAETMRPISNYINNLYKNILVVPKLPSIKQFTSRISADKAIGQNITEDIRIYNPFLKKKKKDRESIVSQEVNDKEKSPFGFFRPAEQALKEGGIVIQRLRVRKGGIAIAGPGGVATAGSGGTAIVGPGGIALTHPRSLAIAGPGARVFSVPENVDLKQFANASKGRSFRFPGATIVATGPVVYYNNGEI